MSSGPERPNQRAQRRVRLAYLVSHPIQYQAPLLRRIAEEPDINLTVFFGSDFSVRGYRDEGVGVKWDIPRWRDTGMSSCRGCATGER